MVTGYTFLVAAIDRSACHEVEFLLDKLKQTKTNAEFFQAMNN